MQFPKPDLVLAFVVVVLLLFDYIIPDTSLWFLQLGELAPCLRTAAENASEVAFLLAALLFLAYLVVVRVYNLVNGQGRGAEFRDLPRAVLGLATLLYLIYCTFSLAITAVPWHGQEPGEEWRFQGASLIGAAAICGGYSAWLLRFHVRSLLALLIGLITIQTLWALADYFANPGGRFVSGTVPRLGGSFHDPAAVYPFFAAGIPLGIALAVSASRPLGRLLYGVSATVLFIALVLTWYRTGIIALTAATVVQWFSLRRLAQVGRLPSVQGMPTASGVLAKIVLPIMVLAVPFVCVARTQGERNQVSSKHSIQGRYRVWRRGMAQLQQHPVFGTGAGSVRVPTYVEDRKGRVSFRVNDFPLAHNQLLQWAIEMGVFGVAFFWCLCAYLGTALCARPRSAEQIGIAAGLLVILIVGLVDVVADVATPQYVGGTVLFVLLVGASLFQEETG